MSNEFVEKDGKLVYIIIIVVLVLAVLGLGGYIIYDKYIANVEEVVKEDNISDVSDPRELTASEAEEYIEKIRVYNAYFYNSYLVEDKKEITNENLLTFAFRMIEPNGGIVTKEKVEDVLHKYFGENVKFNHDNIKCYAGEIIYEYDEETGYVQKGHVGHGGDGTLGTEIFYVSSEVNDNKVTFVVKNVYERYCSDTCAPVHAYYASVDDVFSQSNPVLKAEAYEDSARITRYNKDKVLEKVPETTYNFIIEDNGNFYLDSVSVEK